MEQGLVNRGGGAPTQRPHFLSKTTGQQTINGPVHYRNAGTNCNPGTMSAFFCGFVLAGVSGSQYRIVLSLSHLLGPNPAVECLCYQKKRVSITFTFNLLMRAFFGRDSSGDNHAMSACFLTKSYSKIQLLSLVITLKKNLVLHQPQATLHKCELEFLFVPRSGLLAPGAVTLIHL